MFIKCSFFFRLDKSKKSYRLFFENVININVKVYYLYLNLEEKKKTYNFTNLLNNMIEIPNYLDNNTKYMYIELRCNKTCDEKNIFTLKNIL